MRLFFPASLCALLATATVALAQPDTSKILNAPGMDLNKPGERARAVQQIQALEEKHLRAAQAVARQKGIPLRTEGPNGKITEVAGLDENGELIFIITHNANAAISTGVNQIQSSPYLLNGAGLTVGVWDGGSARHTHQEFNEGPTSRVNVMDGGAVNYHATHVAGTIASSGTVMSNSKGMAPAAIVDSYYWDSDESEIISRAASAAGQFATDIYLSNHSYGYSYGWRNDGGWIFSGTGSDQNAYDVDFGRYNQKSANLDSIAYNAPYYLAFYSAGNENNDGPSTGNTVTINGVSGITYDPAIHPQNDGAYRDGFETCGDHGIAKNVMTIGAANDAVSGGNRNPSSGTIASFSSTGPCDDGRIKPDVVANGVSLYSTYHRNDADYANLSGTSMSSPNSCGSAALLVEFYRELFADSAMRASTLKGLLIHTATDVGNQGPDYTYGWGYVDVKTAADLLDEAATYPDKLSLVEDQVTTATTTQTYNFFWDGVSPIRATLSWTDPSKPRDTAHDDRNPDLVNDLNLKLIAPDNSEYFPFVMPFVGTWTVASMSELATTGVNNTDNVEQVLVNSPGQTGEWTIEVSYAGGLTNGVQDYGLIVSGSSFNPGGNVAFSNDNFSVDEDAGTASVTVDRIGGNAGVISVDYTTGDGTATAGSDYTTTTGTLTWNGGDSATKTISIPITDDFAHEDPEETLIITLSNPSGASISGTNPATLIILEDDNQLPSVDAGSDQIVSLSGSEWSPSLLSPALWLDADDASTIALNGSTVSQWSDKSGNNRHATQATASYQPTLASGGLNGKNVLNFDASSDYFDVDLDFLAGADHSVFVVTKTTTYSNIYGAANGSAGANSLHVGFISSSNYRMNFWNNDWNGAISSNFQAGAANLLNYVWLPGTSKEIFANGKSEGTNSNAGVIGTMSGGGRIGKVVTHVHYGGDIAEFIAFNTTIALEDRQALEGFLAHKWGTASLLASDHPYKIEGPDNASAAANLDGTVSDGDSDPFTITWSVFDGPGSVTFGDPNAVDTTATFTTAGTYTLRLTADDGYGTSSDDVIITVLEEGATTYNVDFQTDGTAGASLTGTTSQIVAEGGDASAVTANAPVDYHFVNWTNGVTPYSSTNPLTVTNVTSDMTLVANFAKTASIAIADDGQINEAFEDGEAILVSLTDSIFTDPITPANWSISGQPEGISKGNVTRINDSTVRILLSGNSTTDYDSDITDMMVTCAVAEVVDAVSPVSINNGVTFTAINDAETIEISDDGWILEGAEEGELITVVLNGGTFVDSLSGDHFTVSNLPTGVSEGTVTRVNANVATIELSGNRTGPYGGSDITDVTVTCTVAGYTDSTSDSSLSDDSGVTLRALSGGSATIDFQDGLESYDGVTDTYIYDGLPSSNYGTASTIRLNNRVGGGPNQAVLRGLLRFDLSSLPTDTTILSAELNFVQDNAIAALVDIVEATSSWGEGTANWSNSNTIFGGTSFGTANTSTTAGAAVPTITLNTAGLNKVQSWVTDPSSNHGFGILTTLAENGEASSMALRSADYTPNTSHRPKLSITYQITGGTPAPEINLQGNGLTIVSGDTTPTSVDHTEFGTSFTGGDTVTRIFTIQNVGDADLALSGSPLVDITGTNASDFSVTILPASSTIAASASTTFEVTFTPSAAGTRTATVSIANDDSDESLYTFAIEGEGVTPPVTYSVTYDGNGNTSGSAPSDSLSPYASGETVFVLGNSGSLLKDGFTFNGWNTTDDGSGTAYAPGSSFTINTNTTLFAEWTANIAGFTLDQTTATVAEAGGTDTFTVVLDSQPASDVVFDVTSSDISEATVAPTTLTFTSSDWDTPQTVTITGVDDDATTTDSAIITVSVNDASSADAYDSLADQAVTVTCTNDDIPDIIVGSISGDTSEGGTGATFAVVLGTQPAADVTIGLSSSDEGEGTVAPSSLTFTNADWSIPQIVTVTGVDDGIADGNQIYTIITATASSSDLDYDGIDPNDVSVTNLDNEFTLTVVMGTGGESVTGGGTKNPDNAPYAISATAATGYSFDNWTVTAGSASFADENSASTDVTAGSDATVQANFSINTYTVTYDGNGKDGGSVPTDANNPYDHGSSVTVLGNTGSLVRAGYTFDGWNTATNGSGTDYTEGANFNIDSDVTLYANWNSPPTVDAGDDQTIYLTGADPWTPADISVARWYDAADVGTITESVGAVSQWDDKSGNTNHATQTNNSIRPVSGTATINGVNAIDFEYASNQSMNIPSIDLIGKEVWAVVVVDDPTTTTNQLVLGAGGNVQVGISPTNGTMRFWQASNSYSADSKSTAVILGNTPTLVGWLGHTTTKKYSINGVLEDTGDNYVSGTMDATYIGRGQYQSMDGAIAEIVITSGELSTDDRQKMEGYLAHKWGLEGNLPVDHPYKNIAPGSPTATAVLDATVNDVDGDPLTQLWTKEGGPSSAVVFDDDTAVDTNATFSEVGTYTLRLTADDGFHQPFDEVEITVELPPISVSIADAEISEDGGTTTATITRIGTTGDLELALSSSDTGEATVSASATILDGNTSVDVTITGVPDDIVDGTETITITATAENNAEGSDTVDVTNVDTITYTVTYDGNTSDGGTVPIDGSSPYSSGATVTVLGNTGTLTKLGYTFAGWNTASDASGTGYLADDTFTIADDTTLYAQWTINTYSVTYNDNGSDGGSIPIDASSPYDHGSSVTVIGNTGALIKTDYTFAGWNTASDGSGTGYVVDDTFNITGDTTLYAQWTINTYSVTYNDNGSDGGAVPTDASSPYDHGSNVIVIGNTGALARTGYTFTGWNTADDGSGIGYVADDNFTIIGNTTLYAQWAINIYTVTYDGNGSDGGAAPTDASSPYDHGSNVIVIANTGSLIRAGYTFSGWNTADDGSGTGYVADDTFAITEDTTLYAQWSQNVAGFTLSKTTSIVAENGGEDSFTVVLDSQPASTVVIDISSSDTNEATVAPASLTFTTGDWDLAQTVTITGVNDDDLGDDAATITASVNDASSDDAYDPLADQTVAVTCTNDDVANNYSNWISGYDVGVETDFTDDPDNDDLDNGMESYFGTHPGEFSVGLVAVDVDEGAGTFTFEHPLNDDPATDISASYRWSKDLSTFHSHGEEASGTTVTFEQGTPSGGMVNVTATVTGTSTDKIFVVIEVTQD